MHIFFDQLFKASEDVRDYYPTSTVEWFSTQVLSKSIKVNLICHTIHWIVPSIHTVVFYGKYGQFRSPNGTSQFWSFSVKF